MSGTAQGPSSPHEPTRGIDPPEETVGQQNFKLIREALGDWPRSLDYSDKADMSPATLSWREREDWTTLTAEEVSNAIAAHSNVATQARTDWCWSRVVAALPADEDLQRLANECQVRSIHTGVPTNTGSVASPPLIFLDDSIRDFTAHFVLCLLRFASPEAGVDLVQHALRTIRLETGSLRTRGYLWQPYDIAKHSELAAVATHASLLANCFWIAHEFAHIAISRDAARSHPRRITFRSGWLSIDHTLPEEYLADRFAHLTLLDMLSIETNETLADRSFLRFAELGFAAVNFSEKCTYVADGAHHEAASERWDAYFDWVEASYQISSRPLLESFVAWLESDVELEWCAESDLSQTSSDWEIPPTVSSDPRVMELLNEMRMACLPIWFPSASCLFFVGQMATGGDPPEHIPFNEVASAIYSVSIPRYNEGFASRSFYGLVDVGRNLVVERLATLDRSVFDSLTRPEPGLTTAEWLQWCLFDASGPTLSPLEVRMMLEVASDPVSRKLCRDPDCPFHVDQDVAAQHASTLMEETPSQAPQGPLS